MKPLPIFSRPAAYSILVAFWAAIYLPGLASVEIKGEEIRRIMPGMHMLESGDWIVPQFNGNPYLRKPPLVNWAIALSVKTLGVRNEWTVRLPSVLAMLALGLVMLASGDSWLGTNASLAAVLITFTCAGIVEKGRLAEIEAIYIALFGMAFSCWLGFIAGGRSRWLTWSVTGLLLGLGLLAKGPPNLGFFYAIAGFIAWRNWRRKAGMDTGLVSWAHVVGIALMLGIFGIWCVPYMRQAAALGAGGVWARQMEQRIGGGNGSTVLWNLLRSLVNFLPWTLAIPLFWSKSRNLLRTFVNLLARRLAIPLFWNESIREELSSRDRILVEAARWPIVLCAFGLMLIPGMLPRYTLPLVIPLSLLLAVMLRAELGSDSLRWPLAAATIAGAAMLSYGIFLAPRIAAHGFARDFAAKVNAVKPPESPIFIFDPSVQPEIFYIHGPLRFQDSVKALPDPVPWLLAPETALKLLRARFREVRVLAEPRDQGGKRFALVSMAGLGKVEDSSK